MGLCGVCIWVCTTESAISYRWSGEREWMLRHPPLVHVYLVRFTLWAVWIIFSMEGLACPSPWSLNGRSDIGPLWHSWRTRRTSVHQVLHVVAPSAAEIQKEQADWTTAWTRFYRVGKSGFQVNIGGICVIQENTHLDPCQLYGFCVLCWGSHCDLREETGALRRYLCAINVILDFKKCVNTFLFLTRWMLYTHQQTYNIMTYKCLYNSEITKKKIKRLQI